MNFLQMIFGRLIGTGADVILWVDDNIDAAFASLVRAAAFIGALLVSGTLIGYWANVPRFAMWLFGFAWLFGGLLLVIFAARCAVALTGITYGYEAIRTVLNQGTEWLPGDGLNLPEGPSADAVRFVYQVIFSIAATLQLLCAYAIIFPVYTNPFAFLVVAGCSWAILFGACIVGSENGTWLRFYGILNVLVGIGLAIAYSLGYMAPNLWSGVTDRIETIGPKYTAMENLASTNYGMAIVLFIAFAGLLLSIVFTAVSKNKKAGLPMVALFVVLLAFLIFLGERTVAAFGPAPRNNPTSIGSSNTAAPSQGKVVAGTQKVFVDAKNYNGINAGYVSSGSKITITGSGTAVWKNINPGNPTRHEECGPGGTSPTGSPLISREEYFSNINMYMCPTALKGALIAKIGDGSWFPVGPNYKGVASSSGNLLLAINDLDPSKANPSQNWSDNSKGFDTTVTVE